MRTSRSFPHYHSRPSRDFSFGGKIHGFLSSCDGATAETLRKHCGVPQNKKSLFTAMLSGMVSRGEIEYENGLYSLPRPVYYEGVLTGNERGFAFFTPDPPDDTAPENTINSSRGRDKNDTANDLPINNTTGGREARRDIFIPAKNLNGAMHKDRVLARVEKRGNGRKDGRESDTGEVVKILSRGYNEIVGAFYKDRRGGRLLPDERKYFSEIYIPPAACKNVKNGVKAVAKIVAYFPGRCPEGEITEILGDDDDFFAEELSIIRSFSLREEFPESVEKEAEKTAAQPIGEIKARGLFDERTGELLSLRRDLREEFFVTIDGADTRDIDDGVSVRKQGENYLLSVHIADVSHYVTAGSELDKEAMKRGTSVYFPDRVLPMLPRALSNGCCSLNEDEDRFAMTCETLISESGETLSYSIFPSLVRSSYRMTYDETDDIFAGNRAACEKFPLFAEQAKEFAELTNILSEKRKRAGEVALDLKETKIIYDEKSDSIEIPDCKPSFSRNLIEQFMVTTNETVAKFLYERGAPCLYRVHESPAPEKAASLKRFAELLGFCPKWNDEEALPRDFAKLLAEAAGGEKETVLSKAVLRSMQKARYDEKNLGHFALASGCYCHFTSPIRRYPDLFVHRSIKAALAAIAAENIAAEGAENGETAEKIAAAAERQARYLKERAAESAKQSSSAERNAEEAERTVDDLYCAVYLADYISQEFDAVISGVTERGFFAELKNAIEGFVPIESIDGYFVFDPDTFTLRGGGTRKFSLGDAVRIRVEDVNFYTRKITFSLAK